MIEASCIKPSWLNVLLSTKYHAATTINVTSSSELKG